MTLIGKAPRPDGLLLVVLGVGPGGGMRMFVWPVKFSRSFVESAECLDTLGVASSSSFDDVLLVLLRDRSCNGFCPVDEVDIATECRFARGVQPSGGSILVGEFRSSANLVMSVAIAEIVLRSPAVSSCTVFSGSIVTSKSIVSP